MDCSCLNVVSATVAMNDLVNVVFLLAACSSQICPTV
jgi:hypothetical protein